MAIQEHVEILACGVKSWNRWRRIHPEIIPDLSGADLSGRNFYRADFRQTSFVDSALQGACLSRCDLRRADLRGASLEGAKLTGANLSEATLWFTNLAWARLRNAEFTQTSVMCCIFHNNLGEAVGLESVRHIGKDSLISIKALLDCSGVVSESFIRACDVPEELIDMLPALRRRLYKAREAARAAKKVPRSKSRIETRHMGLEQWLDLMRERPQGREFVDFMFPNDRCLEDYLAQIDSRSEEEVLWLINSFLIPTGALGSDRRHLRFLHQMAMQNAKAAMEYIESNPYSKRIALWAADADEYPPQLSISWILDLVPNYPSKAIEVIDSYVLTRIQTLPDNRVTGLDDAKSLIRARFIGLPGTKQDMKKFLIELDHRSFERIIERLYEKMGYSTTLTPARGDGGRDVLATKTSVGKKEHIAVECKHHHRAIGVEYVRQLQAVVSVERCTKGAIVATGEFTKGALNLARRDHRIELISGGKLILLLNEYLGINWPAHTHRTIYVSRESGSCGE